MTDPTAGDAERVIQGARDVAARLGSPAIGAEHLVLAALDDPASEQALQALSLDPSAIRGKVEAASRRAKRAGAARAESAETEGAGPSLTSLAKRTVDAARRESRERGETLGALHVLLGAATESRGTFATLLREAGVETHRARAELIRATGGAPEPEPPPVAEKPAAPARTEPPRERSEPPRERTEQPRERSEARESRRESSRESGRDSSRDSHRDSARNAPTEQGRRERGPNPRATSTAARTAATPARASSAASPSRAASSPAHAQPRGVGRLAKPPKSPSGPLWRKVLLLAVPASVALQYMHASPVLIFTAACLAVLPLAAYMGEATEHLSARSGPAIGGLLNATFGNAAELIIALAALRNGMVDLVKASITGSILGNLLLILGLSLVAGGWTRPELKFNRTSAGMSAGMLALAVVGLVLPAVFHNAHPEAAARLSELRLSEIVCGILVLTYVLSLVFTLKTHRNLFGGEAHPTDGPVWTAGKSAIVLALATVGVAIESEILVHATEQVTTTLGLSEVFLGLIIIPIIGNAAEHAAAVVVARKGQIDLALQIALGSSTQVALLIAPILVFAGIFLAPGMDLIFRPIEVIALGLATIVTAIITLDGESHWFEGVQLLAVYGMIAAAAFFI